MNDITKSEGAGAKPEGAGDTAQTGSLLADLRGGGGAGAEAPAGKATRRRPVVSLQTVVIAVVLAGSGGLLYAMRRHGMGAGMTFQTVKIDYPLDRAPGALTADHARVLADLERGGQVNQVPPDKLGKNPFRLESVGARIAEAPSSDPEAESRRRAEMSRQERETRDEVIRKSLESLKIQGIMGGGHPLAIINERAVRVGDSVGEFAVSAIDGLTVSLELDGRVYTLTMDESDPAAPRRSEPARHR